MNSAGYLFRIPVEISIWKISHMDEYWQQDESIGSGIREFLHGLLVVLPLASRLPMDLVFLLT